jgi:hypothetical protein
MEGRGGTEDVDEEGYGRGQDNGAGYSGPKWDTHNQLEGRRDDGTDPQVSGTTTSWDGSLEACPRRQGGRPRVVDHDRMRHHLSAVCSTGGRGRDGEEENPVDPCIQTISTRFPATPKWSNRWLNGFNALVLACGSARASRCAQAGGEATEYFLCRRVRVPPRPSAINLRRPLLLQTDTDSEYVLSSNASKSS